MTPLVLDTQKQFNFTHIFAGAGAFGKVQYMYMYWMIILFVYIVHTLYMYCIVIAGPALGNFEWSV